MNSISKYIWFTYDGCGISIAKRLEQEGNTVIFAQIQDVSELGYPKEETPEDKKLRLSLGDGIIKKYPAKDVLKNMAKMTNKDDYFVVFDFNNLWKYSEMAVKMGFKNGFFPTKKDWEFEEDRDGGKEFVKQYYKDLKVAEKHEFKTIDDAINFLEDTEKVWVLKSYSPEGSTILTSSEEPEEAAKEIVGALKLEKKEYEKDGFLLEQRIKNVIEITPAIVFYNGKPIFTNIDIENKPVGSGSNGNMTGCSSNLIFKTAFDDKINKIAFPQKIYEMAKEHIGMFVWDASILYSQEEDCLYFGEFCSNRWGWDAFFTELSMCSSVSDYFNSLIQNRNPLVKDFGVAVRMFNLKQNFDVPIIISDHNDDHVWLYDAKKKDNEIVSVGTGWDLAVCTASDNVLNKAIKKAYKVMKSVQFTNGYFRPEFDFVSRDYKNSILNRFMATNHKYYDVSDYSESVVNNPQDVTSIIDTHMATLVGQFKDMIKDMRDDNTETNDKK
jgi:hypothetical protein